MTAWHQTTDGSMLLPRLGGGGGGGAAAAAAAHDVSDDVSDELILNPKITSVSLKLPADNGNPKSQDLPSVCDITCR